MTEYDDDGGFPAAHRSLMSAAVTPIPLEEARIQETLRRAQAEFRRRQARRRLVRILAPVLFLTLIAAGFWKWSGRNSDQELPFGGAIALAQNPGDYSFEGIQSASGKIWRDAKGVLTDLIKHGAITPEMRDALLVAIDRPQPSVEAYQGYFEDLRDKVKSGQALDPLDRERLTHALCAGISAIRLTAVHDPAHAEVASIHCMRLRNQLAGEATTRAGDTTQDQGKEKGRD